MKMEKITPKKVSDVAASVIAETKPLIDKSAEVKPEEYRRRWKTVQDAMRKKGYDVAYACGSEIDRSDVAWLAGIFDPIIERYGILIPVEGVPIVLAGPEGGHVIEESAEKSKVRVEILNELQISDEDYRHAHFNTLDGVVSKLGRVRRMAILSSGQFMPYDHATRLIGKFGADNVCFDPELLQSIKYEKSLKELQICKYANIIADAGFRGMLAITVPGITELEIAGIGDYIMKELGAGRTGFPTIVTSGRRGYTVIGPATNKVVGEGDIVSLGISPTFNGYHGIMRRTVRAGAPPTEEQKRFISAVEGLYKVVMDATILSAKKNQPSNYIDKQGKKYLSRLKLKSVTGKYITPLEPYTFIHNTGCSECQEGLGAVTPYTENPLGKNVALMIDIALTGFVKRNHPVFNILYAVIEDAFWKKGREVGVYNKLPLNVQRLTGNLVPLGKNINPYYKELEITEKGN